MTKPLESSICTLQKSDDLLNKVDSGDYKGLGRKTIEKTYLSTDNYFLFLKNIKYS